jgi:DNA polymerase-3 subunit gamma/tau
MSYQVLARKWRPQNFKQMVGQEHVLQALIHALDSQRIHHAYLFTGTRGVGKTTIGRILARCLSCETGITSEPCGTCGACEAISQGRYVDLIEIDAASRTKVEDMRELLENVQYAPAQGRFKIYLIDEVHMLSSHSFNALLKTLEEPPEHVKFLFATTDPQKLPVTILSRCLQFNLKNMTPDKIVSHLNFVLGQEGVSAEDAALWALARAADGSMRDALSLTDQAIAYTEGELKEAPVSAMLGSVDQKKIYGILDALVARDAKLLLGLIDGLAEYSPDYSLVLELIASIFHRVAVEQVVQGATDNAQGDQDRIVFYARNLSPEDVQLYYQISLVSRKDMAITPDSRAGFTMALLRMLAFQLDIPESNERESLPSSEKLSASEAIEPKADPEQPQQKTVADAVTSGEIARDDALSSNDGAIVSGDLSEPEIELPPVDAYTEAVEQDTDSSYADIDSGFLAVENDVPYEDSGALESKKKASDLVDAAALAEVALEAPAETSPETLQEPPSEPIPEKKAPKIEASDAISPSNESVQDMVWPRQAIRLGLSGMTQNLLFNMCKDERDACARMYVESGHYRLLTKNHRTRIEAAIKTILTNVSSVEFVEGLLEGQETPAMWRERMTAARLEDTKKSLYSDPNVQSLLNEFDGELLEDSIVVLGEID